MSYLQFIKDQRFKGECSKRINFFQVKQKSIGAFFLHWLELF